VQNTLAAHPAVKNDFLAHFFTGPQPTISPFVPDPFDKRV
jgi:hypothetical protein